MGFFNDSYLGKILVFSFFVARNHICRVPHLAGKKSEVEKGELTHSQSHSPSERLTALSYSHNCCKGQNGI